MKSNRSIIIGSLVFAATMTAMFVVVDLHDKTRHPTISYVMAAVVLFSLDYLWQRHRFKNVNAPEMTQ